MKIAIIVNGFPCRSETFITNQITGLIDRGHDVQVYANRRENVPGLPTSFKEYDLGSHTFYFLDGMRWMPKNKLLRLVRACCLFPECWKNGKLEFMQVFNISRFGKKAASLELFYKGMALAKYGLPDIVHCHFGPNGQIAVALKEVGVIKGKIITTFHGYDISSYVKENGRHVYDYLFEQGDLFITISERGKSELIKLGCKKEKIVVHKIGVNLDQLDLGSRRARNEGKVRVLSVGRFIEKKGLEYGIRAVAAVVKKCPEIEYQIVGDGELRGKLTQLIKQLNVDRYVKFLGWKSQEDVANLLKNVDIFLAPCVTGEDGDQEGIPVVIMEALACGLPVLSTRHSGIPELVQDKESGFLVAEKDTSALAERIEYLVRHPEKWDHMGRAGRKWVEEHHDINRLNDRLARIYECVLHGEMIVQEPPDDGWRLRVNGEPEQCFLDE